MERDRRPCLFSRSIHMLDIRALEKHTVFGGHVRRSRENVIAEKKESGGWAPLLLYARSRGLTEKG